MLIACLGCCVLQPVGVQSLRHLLDAKKQAKKVGSDSGVPSKSSSSQGLSLKDIRARRFAQRAEAKSTPASNTPVAVAARPVDLKVHAGLFCLCLQCSTFLLYLTLGFSVCPHFSSLSVG